MAAHGALYTKISERLCLNSAADVRILLSLLEYRDLAMSNALIFLALASVGAYLVGRVLRSSPTRGIDVGALSSGWIAEHRREEPR
jgi:hypothetical protein